MSKLVYSNQTFTDGGLGAEPPAAGGHGGLGAKPWAILVWGHGGLGDFCKFLEKKLFKSHWIAFRTSSEPFQRTRFLTFQSQSKKFNCSILLLQSNPKTRLES